MVDNHKPVDPNKDPRFPDGQAQFNAARIKTDPERGRSRDFSKATDAS
jgi:hypothetical protein